MNYLETMSLTKGRLKLGYNENDEIYCEACHRDAEGFFCINKSGTTAKDFICLCRRCHTMAHNEEISKSELEYIHNNFLQGRRKRFMK